MVVVCKKSLLNLFYLKWQKEQSIFRLSEEVVEWGQSNAVQSDWCWSQCVCVCVCVCVLGGGGSEGQSSVVRGVREGRGGKDGREFSFLTPDGWSCPSVCWSWPEDNAVSSLMAADWRSYVTGGWDHLQCRGLCGWDGCCRCLGGRGERHQRSSQLLSLSVEGTCGRTRYRRHTTQWCS